MSLSASASSMVCSGVAGALGVSLIIFRPLFRSSQSWTLLAGALVSLIYILVLIAVCNYKQVHNPNSRGSWPDVFFSLIISSLIGVTVHPVTFTTSTLFSGVATFLVAQIEQ